TGVSLLTLAIGIGANTAVFSVVQGVLLKPLPYPRPDQLITVAHTAPGVNVKDLPVSPSCYFIYREQGRTFEDIGLFAGSTVGVTGLAEPEQVPALNVTDGVLGILGVRPVLGRSLTRSDDTPGSPDVILISHGYWQRKFGGGRDVIGRAVTVDGKTREIVGVLPEGFGLFNRTPSILLPFRFERSKLTLGNFSYQSVARLKPNVTITQAGADINRMIPTVQSTFAPPKGASAKMFENTRMAANLRPLKQDVIGDVATVLWLLMGTIGMVLLIACANVANLMLVRAEGRQHELGIRAALGASWSRLAGELLLESVTLGVLGGALGVALAYWALRALVAAAPAGLPRLNEISLDPPALLFALAVSLLAGAFFGAVPMFKYAGPAASGAIRHGGRTASQSRERHRARSTLVVAQVALALILLIGAGLMIRTFQAMRKIEPGFTRPEQVQTLTISIPQAMAAEPDQVARTQRAILEKIALIPGVAEVSFANGVPMDGNSSFDPVFAEDHPTPEGKTPPIRRYKFAAPGFFHAIGNPLLAGRDYTWSEIEAKAPVAIITENVAREYWGSPRAALGKRIRESLSGPWREIVGVVGNERDNGVERPAPTTVYWPILCSNFWGQGNYVRRTVTYVVRSSRTGSQGFLNEIRQAVWSAHSDLPVAGVRTLQDVYSRSMARTSFALVMLAIAGAMAMLLGSVGIYGVISYSVSQRTREIGIRMALGAQQTALTRMFIGHGLKLAATGLALGLGAAFALSRGMSSLLFGITPADPLTYAGVSIGLALAAALASYFPSRRAVAVDPVEALRAE
ncbi:MAG TPA: ABC transporter permease, partial [Bryobacteraceae bacterium]|nr:ABC transporter permease [Bryobacteraceae bacterium]